MAKERIGMRKIKEVLRMGFEKGISMNKIALCCNVGRSTVQEYFRRFKASGLSWPLPEDISDEVLENKLFPKYILGHTAKQPLNYEYLVEEMKKPDVTVALLWEEYKQVHPNGYQYSQFSNLFRRYRQTLNYSMHQEHKAGEKTFADFGDGLKLIDPKTGAEIPTKLFVDVWGASNYTFAQAVLGKETLENWINCSVSAFEYFGCCSKAIVPDNPKAVITKACRYEPDINPSYAEFAQHYGVVVFPARPRKPKDKAKVEAGVKLAKRWILAKLRNRIFHSLRELNEAIFGLLEVFNNKQMKRLKKSRKELFEVLDKPNALPLPESKYEFAEWKKVSVNIDYHIEFDDHYYSVPYTLIRQELEIRATRNIIEVFKKGQRLCSHQRSYRKYYHSTKPEHMPKSHQQYLEWTPSRILEWAAKYGPAAKELVERIMKSRKFPEQAYRSCLGIIRLEKHFSAQRIDAACRRALEYRVESYQGVKNILLNNLDSLNSKEENKKAISIQHENIRGAEYFEAEKGGISEHGLGLKNASNRATVPCLEKDKSENEPKTKLELISASQ